MDTRMQALATELANAAPLPPPMPVLERRPRRVPSGLGAAVAAFAAIVVVAIGAVIGGTMLVSTDREVASSEIFEAAGGTPVAVVTDDGETLRGYLWRGGSDAVAMVTAYGESTSDLIPFALASHADGATVMVIEPRGAGSSTGRADASMLPADMAAMVDDLSTRGVESVTLIGFRHSATASIVVAADPPPTVSAAIAFFPFQQYQGLDAMSVVGDARIPLTIIGASQPSELGPWAGHLIRAGGSSVSGSILDPLPADALFLEHYRNDIVRIIRGAGS